MDAFAVAVFSGAFLKNVSMRQIFRLSWHFGLFQAMMLVLGWCAGLTIRSFIEKYDHWVAFGLLAIIGSNMIMDAIREKDDNKRKNDPTKGISLVVLSLATSIDAMAVGLSISILKLSIWIPALVVGIVAGLFTIAGLKMGSKAGSSLKIDRYAEFLGGLVLMAIGINILYEHGVF